MTSRERLIRKLRTLIIARLFIATLLLFCIQYVFQINAIVFYAIIALTALLSVVYVLWWMVGKGLRLLAHVQIVMDLLLESILVYYTGGVDSVFANIYMLTILSAAIVLSPAASFYFAGASSLFFIGTILTNEGFLLARWIPAPFHLAKAKSDAIYLFYASYVRVTVFFLIAIVAYYFSKNIRRLETQVKNQERLVALGEVASSIAHEIRNPLASISGGVELLSSHLKPAMTQTQSRLMGAIVEESSRIKRIFSGLLDYSRVLELRVESVELEPYLDQILELMKHQPDYRPEVEVYPQYRGKKIRVQVDPEYLKQALMNILTNAYQVMPGGGKLLIEAQQTRKEVELSITDTGPGIDPKVQATLFMPFKTGRTSGTGLGLALAHRIISQHDGKILIESDKGKGARVEIRLPK